MQNFLQNRLYSGKLIIKTFDKFHFSAPWLAYD